MDAFEITIAAGENGQRLDRVLAQRSPEISRSTIQRWIEQGRVTLEGRPIVAKDKAVTGQRVRVNFAPAANRKANGLIFASVEEGEYRDGKWTRTRIWNGDQTDYGLNLTDAPRTLRVRLATY